MSMIKLKVAKSGEQKEGTSIACNKKSSLKMPDLFGIMLEEARPAV